MTPGEWGLCLATALIWLGWTLPVLVRAVLP
jgi:hypothetical protein